MNYYLMLSYDFQLFSDIRIIQYYKDFAVITVPKSSLTREAQNSVSRSSDLCW